MAPWHLYLMAGMYIIAGVMHFVKPKVYLPIMPSYIPAHKTMVSLSGVAEITLGILLFFEQTRDIALWGIIAMLIIFFTVHIDMFTNERIKKTIPMWIIILRIPLQFGLIFWAYWYL